MSWTTCCGRGGDVTITVRFRVLRPPCLAGSALLAAEERHPLLIRGYDRCIGVRVIRITQGSQCPRTTSVDVAAPDLPMIGISSLDGIGHPSAADRERRLARVLIFPDHNRFTA